MGARLEVEARGERRYPPEEIGEFGDVGGLGGGGLGDWGVGGPFYGALLWGYRETRHLAIEGGAGLGEVGVNFAGGQSFLPMLRGHPPHLRTQDG